jgi:hypothetical protein
MTTCVGAPVTPPDSPSPLPTWELEFLVRRTQSLLAAQVPLSLLLDLADPEGPDSSAFYAAEPADATWAGQRVG